MEEKNLLKEITFLSRLIGQHKNKLRSHNITPSYSSQRTVSKVKNGQKSIQNSTYEIPVQGYKSTISQYSKVNCTLPEATPKQNVHLSGTNFSERDPKVPQKLPSSIGIPALHVRKTKQTSSEESCFGESKKKIAGSSVHINPNFFASTNTQQEITSLRCKSVYINPKLLGAVAKTAKGSNETQISFQILPNYSNNSSHDKVLQTTQSPCTSTVVKRQTTIVPSQISATKSANLSVPLRTPTAKKKCVYRSKTKLVDTAVNTPAAECKVLKKSVTPVTLQNTAKTIKTPHGGVLLAVSRTKLVRLPGKVRRASSSKIDICTPPSIITKSQYRYRRTTAGSVSSPILRTARKVCSKYRNAAMVTMQTTGSKYRLDRRLVKTSRKGKPMGCSSLYKVDHRSTMSARILSTRANRVRGHLLLSPVKRSSFTNKVWASTAPLAVQKIAISHKKLLRIGCNPGSRSHLQNSALVRIGGLLYKASRTKLILSKTSEKLSDTPMKSRTVVKRRNLNSGHIVYVRGNKFVMDQSGKTLKRVTQDCAAPKLSTVCNKRKFRVSRVDIGGVTYIQKTPTVLVRTNTHTARNLVSTAKQRSIAFLAQKMRKINTPCLFYRRFGRCPRQEKGRCELVHDPKYIDICRKFLQGKCILVGCLLSHDVGPEKMPTCRFFLEGCCVRDLCPYLHVKVNDRAPICRNFLQGYCIDGPECLKRHILLCPEFDKNGSCAKGKYCPYPHSTVPRVQRAICSDPPITANKTQSGGQSDSSTPTKRKRYYETDSDDQKEDHDNSPAPPKMKRYYEADSAQDTQSDLDASGDDLAASVQSLTESPGNVRIRGRPKIGDLPSFIALESFEFD